MPGLFICAPGGDLPRVIGWTSAQPSRFDPGREPVRLPVVRNHPRGDTSMVVNHTFAVRIATLPNGYYGPVIQLAEGQDQTLLPDWTPLVEVEGRPQRVYARDIILGTEYPLQQVPPIELHRYRDGQHGRPMWWAPDGHGVQVYPEPDANYSVHWEPRRTYSLGDLGVHRIAAELRLDYAIEPAVEAAILRTMREMSDRAAHEMLFQGTVPDVGALTAETIRRARDLLLPDPREALPTYPRIERQWPRIFAGEAGVLRAAEMCYTVLAPLLAEGAAVHFDAALEHVAYGLGYAITRERIDGETVQRSKERARGLLKSLLTADQWAEFERRRVVTEKIDGCEYQLRPGDMIEARKPRLIGSVRERWCVGPQGDDWIPDEDKLIGQLLHLRAGPDKLRAKANVFRG